MKKGIYTLILVVFAWLQGSYKAQDMEIDDSFVFELGLPNGFVNAPFKNIMQGVVYVSPMYQYTLRSGLMFGAGVHYSYFNINQFRINQKISGGMHNGAAFIKLGHEKFWTPSLATDIGVKAGFAQTAFVTDTLKSMGITYNSKQSAYIEPNIGICLAADVNASFRLTIGYAFYGFGYKPWDIGINSDLGYSASELNKVSSYLIVGFGYSRYFNGKKSTNSGWDEE
ncbi:MAG: hypothetical protein ACK5F0_03710 [Flavobacteriales bacterium]|jgi:hypothetical protein